MFIFKYIINPFLIPIIPSILIWSNQREEINNPNVETDGIMHYHPKGEILDWKKEIILASFAHLIWAISTILTPPIWNEWQSNHFAVLIVLLGYNIILVNLVHTKKEGSKKHLKYFIILLIVSTVFLYLEKICNKINW